MNIDLLTRKKKGLAKLILDMCGLFQFKQLITGNKDYNYFTNTNKSHIH